MKKIVEEFKSSVINTYKNEGFFAAIMWTVVLPIYMIASVITDVIYDGLK